MKTIETKAALLDCGHPESPHESFTSGYGVDKDGKKHCYACCAEADKTAMRGTGKICLYLTTKPDVPASVGVGPSSDYGTATISNWPGSLKFTGRYHKGRHNIARTRYDVWFKFEGQEWWGVQYGDWTQIVHCKRIKS